MSSLLRIGEEKLGYLKIVTPRFAFDNSESPSSGRFSVSKDGAVVEGGQSDEGSGPTARHKYVHPGFAWACALPRPYTLSFSSRLSALVWMNLLFCVFRTIV